MFGGGCGVGGCVGGGGGWAGGVGGGGGGVLYYVSMCAVCKVYDMSFVCVCM